MSISSMDFGVCDVQPNRAERHIRVYWYDNSSLLYTTSTCAIVSVFALMMIHLPALWEIPWFSAKNRASEIGKGEQTSWGICYRISVVVSEFCRSFFFFRRLLAFSCFTIRLCCIESYLLNGMTVIRKIWRTVGDWCLLASKPWSMLTYTAKSDHSSIHTNAVIFSLVNSRMVTYVKINIQTEILPNEQLFRICFLFLTLENKTIVRFINLFQNETQWYISIIFIP